MPRALPWQIDHAQQPGPARTYTLTHSRRPPWSRSRSWAAPVLPRVDSCWPSACPVLPPSATVDAARHSVQAVTSRLGPESGPNLCIRNAGYDKCRGHIIRSGKVLDLALAALPAELHLLFLSIRGSSSADWDWAAWAGACGDLTAEAWTTGVAHADVVWARLSAGGRLRAGTHLSSWAPTTTLLRNDIV